MNRKIAFTALSVAIVLGSASTAMAGGKKLIDPREAYQAHSKGRACDINPACNGWTEYLQGVKAGKKYNPPSIVIGTL